MYRQVECSVTINEFDSVETTGLLPLINKIKTIRLACNSVTFIARITIVKNPIHTQFLALNCKYIFSFTDAVKSALNVIFIGVLLEGSTLKFASTLNINSFDSINAKRLQNEMQLIEVNRTAH